jgi:membrane protein DedA with SNARE-associated domain
MLEQLGEYLEVFIFHFGFWAVLVTMTLESMGMPLPSEIIMPLAGFLVSLGQLEMWEAITAGTLGCTAGSYFSYLLGRKWGDQVLTKVGRFLLISPRSMKKAVGWFQRYGKPVVFWARLLPVIRGVVSYPAGSARFPLWQFLFLSTLGSLIWCWLLAWLGFVLEEEWKKVHDRLSGPVLYIALGILLALFCLLAFFLWRRSRKQRNQE